MFVSVTKQSIKQAKLDRLTCFDAQLNIYLDQSSVLFFVQSFKHTLFPVSSQCPWRSLGSTRALTSFSTYVTFGSSWTRWACGPLRSQCPCRSLGAWRAFISLFTCVTFISSWSRGSLRTGRTRNTCWSRGSRASWDTWDSWRANASTITTWSIRKLLSTLIVESKRKRV